MKFCLKKYSFIFGTNLKLNMFFDLYFLNYALCFPLKIAQKSFFDKKSN